MLLGPGKNKDVVITASTDQLRHYVSEHADDATFFSQGGVLHGSDAIRQFFGTLFQEFGKPGMSFDLVQQEVDGDTAYIVWKAESADNLFEIGTDTFIVQNGKIVTQTFAGKITPKR